MPQPYLKFPMRDLELLSEILKRSRDPSFPRHLTDTTRKVRAQVDYAIQNQHVHYMNYDQPWQVYILPTKLTPTAVLWQNSPLLWVHLLILPVKVLNPCFETIV